ncbi:ABC transporter substrate-binding protein [Actinomadura graeca]|uniref:ABC transporter substrate-binding protein n=1 Tax=Actinomadura graeca TaxID=2750812 RepID=A0ABX8QUU8_9ACTN|nr:ABC transporter substrate-binding protein [Actinomadura graeca]QXJ22589.1 ABC transporter substrate-binding protein [Actinomadura graeca]
MNDRLAGQDGLGRRDLLRTIGLGGAAMTAAPLLAACSGGSTASSARPTGKPVRGGRLRLGFSGGGASSGTDAHVQLDTMSGVVAAAIYEGITFVDPDFKLARQLAESIEHNAEGDQWTIRVKQGVEFHNGKTLTAEDVIHSFERMLDHKTHATGAGQIGMIASMRAMDERTVRFALARPTAWFDQAIGDGQAFGIVPVGYDPKKPVGTGPFKCTGFTAGVNATFERHPNYHGDAAFLDGVTATLLGSDSARYNALVSGQMDAVIGLTAAQIAQAKGRSDLVVFNSEAGFFYPITMRVDSGALADVRLRQALRLCLDRKRVVLSAYGGYAQAGNDLYGRYDPDLATDLVRANDLAKARALVREAGKQGATLTLNTADLGPGLIATCQVLAENAARIGLNVKVNVLDSATLFGPNYLQWDFAVDTYPASAILTTSSLNDGPRASINESHFKDPEYAALWEKASAEFDAAKRKEHLHEMQRILFERGGWIIPVFPNTLGAYNKKVAGFPEKDLTGFGMTRLLGKVGFTA